MIARLISGTYGVYLYVIDDISSGPVVSPDIFILTQLIDVSGFFRMLRQDFSKKHNLFSKIFI